METWQAILIGAVGTWVIAIIAVGDRALNYFFKPKLRVVDKGEFSGTLAKHGDQKVRYYLIRVRNLNRTHPATDAELVATRIEKSGSAGRDILFDEFMPMGWVRQELYPSRARKIGRDAIAALFFVREDGALGLAPALGPDNVLAAHFPLIHRGRTTLWITLQATSTEVDSPPIRLKIAWDGQWHDGKAEIESGCMVSLDPLPKP